MGRPPKYQFSSLRTLAMLRDEFVTAAAKGDAYFSRLTVARERVLDAAGAVDEITLNLLSEAITEGMDLLVIGSWAHDPSMPDCYHEFLWARDTVGWKEDLLAFFGELSESALRAIATFPELAERIKVAKSDLVDHLAWDCYWLDLLVRLGLPGTHPVVRTRRSRLSYDRRFNDCEFFGLGQHSIVLRNPPAEPLDRLKKIARGPSTYEELGCGVLRGSAYALDWLIQEAESKMLA